MEMVFQKSEQIWGGGGEMDILHSTNKLFKSKHTFYHTLWPSWFSETYKINWYFCNDCFSLMVGEPYKHLHSVTSSVLETLLPLNCLHSVWFSCTMKQHWFLVFKMTTKLLLFDMGT